MNNKITQVKQWMSDNQIDLTYIDEPSNIAYFSGYESDPHERIFALFIPLDSEPFIFLSALEVETVQNSSWKYPVYGYLDNENPWEKISKTIHKHIPNVKTIALEKNSLSVTKYEAFTSYFPNVDFSRNITPQIENMKLYKDSKEISRLIEAGHWADVALEIGIKTIKDRVTELEIVAEIEYQLKKQGVSSMSFDTLVLTGKNTANPHGAPGKNPINPRDFVLFDLGVVWNGYCSDVSRTVAFRRVSEKQKLVYDTVKKAQKAAFDAVRPGITAGQLDEIAREVISEAGFGKYFIHRLGHGIGTTVHEYPSLITGNDLVIEKGMCFSLEPGIYIPNEFGVRIEDCVYVTEDGCESFTTTAKDLLIVD